MNISVHTLCVALATMLVMTEVQAYCFGNGNNHLDQQCRQRMSLLDSEGQEAVDAKAEAKEQAKIAEQERREDRELDRAIRAHKHLRDMDNQKIKTVTGGLADIISAEKEKPVVVVDNSQQTSITEVRTKGVQAAHHTTTINENSNNTNSGNTNSNNENSGNTTTTSYGGDNNSGNQGILNNDGSSSVGGSVSTADTK